MEHLTISGIPHHQLGKPIGAIVGEIRITLVLRAEVEGALGGRDYGSIGLEVLSIISSPLVELSNARPGPLDALGGSFF